MPMYLVLTIRSENVKFNLHIENVKFSLRFYEQAEERKERGCIMAWKGGKIKALAEERKLKINKIAEELNVTRQAVNKWINGQVPKGQHLVRLSTLLDVNPKYFFSDDIKNYIKLPLHRRRGVAKVTEEVEEKSFQLASSYEKLFKMTDPGLVQVLRVGTVNEQSAKNLAQGLREISGIERNEPMDYDKAFELQYKLGIVVVFRDFPDSIKSYAFYCKIHNHRVVFVNNATNVLDLIFPLLHETIHAILDEKAQEISYNEEENFCDLVASYVQFPDEYINMVSKIIDGLRKNVQINKIKFFSGENGHAIFGLVTRFPNLDYRDFAGADRNLKKDFPTIGDVLFDKKDPRDYIDILGKLTPHFIQIVTNQIGYVSNRTIGEWLGLESILDAEMAIKELKKKK